MAWKKWVEKNVNWLMIIFGQARKSFWGWLGRSGSGFWSNVMRLFKFPVMALRVLTIYPQDFPHSTSEFLAWPLCHCHSCLWEQTQTLYCSLKEPMSSGPCLHASLCHSPWCFLYSSQSSSTRTWSSSIKSMSLHVSPTEKCCLQFHSSGYHRTSEVPWQHSLPFTIISHF